MSYTTEIKSLEGVLTKLQKKYEKTTTKPLGDAILDVTTAIRTVKSIK
jgi:hypothetical protein